MMFPMNVKAQDLYRPDIGMRLLSVLIAGGTEVPVMAEMVMGRVEETDWLTVKDEVGRAITTPIRLVRTENEIWTKTEDEAAAMFPLQGIRVTGKADQISRKDRRHLTQGHRCKGRQARRMRREAGYLT